MQHNSFFLFTVRKVIHLFFYSVFLALPAFAHISADVENYLQNKPFETVYTPAKDYAKIVKGKELVALLEPLLKQKINQLKEKGIQPCLHVIVVSPDAASQRFLEKKKKACEEFGIIMDISILANNISQEDLLLKIATLNADQKVHGIMLHLPLPAYLKADVLLDSIAPQKDVDGLSFINQGKLVQGKPVMIPATALGCFFLLRELSPLLNGKQVVMMGRSNLVGKPLAFLLLAHHGTVTIVHSKTKNPEKISQDADILISATGIPSLVKENWVKKGALVLDVGISFPDGKTPTGDVDFKSVLKKVAHITPVPEGIGPLTVFMTMINLVKAASYCEN
ncbi:MAG: bifunctional 5,10-methylenetetrahydrofolate dehydrogenase/5,10-methenyltetrahydrofolate cyclohydrolase [Alphaproteobacteria bacterium]|nr:bifunctional 5,10-methylenetetrahydrofolate dehydrogenase/5,10-methenyltetrahydrofolate cyclohydrolase [Alphaproteobacteria bacterium]MBP9777392.1 bifunctional 5,10-methylenetetrahydrofolate dehydrogenase/5,10-methenyltetrahydrofolate cyclohydrolase [Alphaproteobacteria bacterium]